MRLQDGKLAVQLVNRALATDWRIILKETYRTSLTIVAAYLLYVTPHKLYSLLENAGLKLVGAIQKQQIQAQNYSQLGFGDNPDTLIIKN